MNNWKLGDKVYYFYHSHDSCIVWNIHNLVLDEDEITSFDRFGNPRFGDGYVIREWHHIYRTKNEAIDAMIAYLQKLRTKDD